MVSHALAAQQQRAWANADAPLATLRIEYLAPARAAPAVLRLADTDDRFCVGMQQAYLCSEKRKVRKGADPNDAQAAERLRRCKQADRMRHSVHTRTKALTANRTL
jgi:hypothetical protein